MAKKKMIKCKNCGKKYSSAEDECPHCASDEISSSHSALAAGGGEIEGGEEVNSNAPSFSRGQDDIAKWLMGDDEGISDWMAGTPTRAKTEGSIGVDTKPQAASSDHQKFRAIEDWLQGKLDDITPWLTGESEAGAAATEAKMAEGPLLEDHLEFASEQYLKIVEDLKNGKSSIDDVGEQLKQLIAEANSFKTKNEEMQSEIESIRKGSTALAKYFKSYQGKDEYELRKIADDLAKEMAAREELEFENLELKASLDTLREELEKKVKNLPPEEQEIRKLQLSVAEKEKFLAERESFLKEKEKHLSTQEAESRHEMRERFTAELQDRIRDFEKSEMQLKAEMEKLTIKNKELEINLKHKVEETALLYQQNQGGEMIESMKERLQDTQRLERELTLRDQQMQSIRDKLLAKENELEKLKEPMRYKEEEMLRREEDLMHREKLMEEELKRLEIAKAEMTSQDELTLKKRLEDLQAEVTTKEEEIQSKEKYLSAKEEELKMREQSLISDEIDKREEERALEFKIDKVKTGILRLDDLLIGGLPFGANVLVYGPAFTGKEVLVNCFVAEGLRKGIPVIWVTTEKTPLELREEMKFVLSGFEEYEKRNLVRFVDSYSRSMGDESTAPNVKYIDSPTDFKGIQEGVESAAKELMAEHKYYRFVFRSISTMIAYLDPATAFKLINPIVGRRKRDRAVSMYIIEKGMHGEQEIQMVGSLMDGMIELKVENLNTFLSVKGIGEAQSRAWIRYTATKSSVNIGSFALDHIR